MSLPGSPQERAFYKALSKKLRMFRDDPELSQAALAAKIQSNRSAVGRMEQGIQGPTPWEVRLLADALGVSVEDIIPELTADGRWI